MDNGWSERIWKTSVGYFNDNSPAACLRKIIVSLEIRQNAREGEYRSFRIEKMQSAFFFYFISLIGGKFVQMCILFARL
ncbi:hypothetical protein JCM10914_4088 [Paenibacillus sp. JCM 10914]|nr:hypothetical protein JCM10914_4088 [Paenibacillus sp. JCM 10914]